MRFLNRHVRKREGIAEFRDILPILSSGQDNISSLDLGCGIGAQLILLDEFGLNPYGIDLSDKAIEMGKKWLTGIDKKYLADKLYVASVAKLPFDDNFFSVCVSHGVLDSMPRDIAAAGLKEVKRVLKPEGIMYLDLIMDGLVREGDEIVEAGYEKGTTQSYFTVKSIEALLQDFEIVDFIIIAHTDRAGKERAKRAHLIIKNSNKK